MLHPAQKQVHQRIQESNEYLGGGGRAPRAELASLWLVGSYCHLRTHSSLERPWPSLADVALLRWCQAEAPILEAWPLVLAHRNPTRLILPLLLQNKTKSGKVHLLFWALANCPHSVLWVTSKHSLCNVSWFFFQTQPDDSLFCWPQSECGVVMLGHNNARWIGGQFHRLETWLLHGLDRIEGLRKWKTARNRETSLFKRVFRERYGIISLKNLNASHSKITDRPGSFLGWRMWLVIFDHMPSVTAHRTCD